MSETKIKIAESSDGPPYWGPLMPIIKFCLEQGCKLDGRALEDPFSEDKNGSWSCSLIGPITIQTILDHFELPDHFQIGRPFPNSICDSKHRSVISFTSFEHHKALVQEMKLLEASNAEKRAARRKRIEERKKLNLKSSGEVI